MGIFKTFIMYHSKGERRKIKSLNLHERLTDPSSCYSFCTEYNFIIQEEVPVRRESIKHNSEDIPLHIVK